VPGTPTIVDNGNNTFTISGHVSTAGTNNPIASSTLYYTIDGSNQQSKSITTASGASYSHNFNVPTSKDKSVIKAWVVCKFNYGSASGYKTRTSDTYEATVKHYSAIVNPKITVKDNGNNTFTITGTNATDGHNNKATTKFTWSFDTASYNTTMAGTTLSNHAIGLTDKTKAIRAVFAKAVATPAWSGDTTRTVQATPSNPTEIKHYVVPKDPGIPKLSFTRHRLTVEEPWTFTWAPSKAWNTNSPVKGYYIMLNRCPSGKATSVTANWESVIGLVSSNASNNITINASATNTFTQRQSTSCTAVINTPADFGFAAGDSVKIAVRPFTINGTGGSVNDPNNWIESAEELIYEAGVLNVKTNSGWKQGKVFVKTADGWKKAKAVEIKTAEGWKESL
jgi:hypothetical protein